MGRQSRVSRGRRQEIAREARHFCSVALTSGLTVDQIQDVLVSRFPGELARGEARMHAMGWTVPIVREGLLALAAQAGGDGQGQEAPGLELIDVARWLRGAVRPTVWLPRLYRLFRCHQAHLGWPPQGNEVPVDCTPRTTEPATTEDIRSAARYAICGQRPDDMSIGASPSPSQNRPEHEHDELKDVLNFIAWVTSTNTSEDAIAYLDAATLEAARDHTYQPPATVLTKVLRIHGQIRTILKGGRQVVRQGRELLRIDAELLAHACLLFGDVHRNELAAAYGEAAILAAGEAGSSPAAAFSARAQIARWRHCYADAADLAAQGFACSPPTSLRVLLACQEANAAALTRDVRRARDALSRADAAFVDETSDSAWSCPPARHALYRLGVALHSGDPKEALHEAVAADAAWSPGHPRPFGTWAHARIAAGIAHLMLASVDGASEQISPVLALPNEFRLATLMAHLATVDTLLQQRRVRGAREATSLRDQIAHFTCSASATTGG